MLDAYNIPLGKIMGNRYYKGLKLKLVDNIEQGEEIEEEVKGIFKQQKL